MWRPGFEFIRQVQAELSGYHRRLAIYSHHHRGTVERPGLVLGLDRSGSCVGIAFEVAEQHWTSCLTYVRNRELISDAYQEIIVPVSVEGQADPVLAVTYAVNRQHLQCAPPMSVEETMAYVAQGHGLSGSCAEYVRNTLTHLRAMGHHDAELERLAPALENLGGAHP